ncbi:MAG: proteasome accessory factor PafA2 family protein [Verrucomicrobiales bacterium]|nr:proteasome accessory factor PafA2 family protein [Verrucomicrobiales bacterium]
MTRLAGIETEYGCLTLDPNGSLETVRRVRDWLFAGSRYGLIDRQQRDWDEPAGNGGFLFNGGRAYLDMGHLELCTAECLGLRDLIAHDAAGDALICEALSALRIGNRTGFIRNNVDHYSGATFGCHENYLVRRSAPLNERNVLSLLAFLTLRVLYTGAGKVGGVGVAEARISNEAASGSVPFQLSQRADYIQNDLFEWVQFNRAIINTRDEPLADARRFRRLHLLHGDTSVLPDTLALKIGTTSLVLDLLEIDHLPKVALLDAVGEFRKLSANPSGPWIVELAESGPRDAVELLGEYYEVARAEFGGRDAETDEVLASWKAALDALAGDVSQLVGTVDWVTKRWLFTQFVEAEGIAWDSAWLKSQDLEFHHTDPKRCLARQLIAPDSPWNPREEDVAAARSAPPSDTRAAARSRLMRFLSSEGLSGFVDWEVVDTEGVNPLMLLDPFDAHPADAGPWCEEVRQAIRRKESGARDPGSRRGSDAAR